LIKLLSLQNLRTHGEVDFDETQWLSGFFKYFKRLKHLLVSYIGRSFDLSVLKYRAMVYGINSRWVHQAGTSGTAIPTAVVSIGTAI